MIQYFVADAFADALFEGNPAGVCVLDRWLLPETMRKIAMENNLSETGFVVKESDEPCTYALRWFTPVDEIDLCGHCTFGAAYILFRFFEQAQMEIHFDALKCGHHLVVSREGDTLTMAFPSLPPVRYEYSDYMGEGLGSAPAEGLAGRARFNAGLRFRRDGARFEAGFRQAEDVPGGNVRLCNGPKQQPPL